MSSSSSSSMKNKADILENCCSELEFDMWDGQFEFVGNAYDASPAGVDVLKLPKISRNSHVFGVQKVISSHRSFMTIFTYFFFTLVIISRVRNVCVYTYYRHVI